MSDIIKELKEKVVEQKKIIDLLTEENNTLKKKLMDVMNEVP